MTQTQATVLVTGGAGFIGSNFVRSLLATESHYHVVVLDKLTYAGSLANLAPVRDHPRFTFIQGDIGDPDSVRRAMSGCNQVVNFAAETHVDRSIADSGDFIRTSVLGTHILLEAARDLGIERFIQISTDEVYGNAQAADGRRRPSLETDTLRPLSPYAASKAGADHLVLSYRATYGLPTVITRCSNNYGPYQHPEKQLPLFIVNALARRRLPIYGDGEHTRNWIHVLDHCRALQVILQAPAELVHGEIFNIGTSEERSTLENARTILEQTGGSSDLIAFVTDRPGHVRRHAVDYGKITRTLGWKPEVRFEEGISRTIDWYRRHTSWVEAVLGHPESRRAFTREESSVTAE